MDDKVLTPDDLHYDTYDELDTDSNKGQSKHIRRYHARKAIEALQEERRLKELLADDEYALFADEAEE